MAWKIPEKVYCDECKWINEMSSDWCEKPIMFSKDGYRSRKTECYVPSVMCCNKNKKNNCSDFEKKPLKKWWEFWK